MMENWRAVPGYVGLYEVSDWGRVRRLDRTQTRSHYGWNRSWVRKGGLVAQHANKAGYRRVTLFRGKEGSDFFVHRLVCLAFIGEPPSPMHQAAHDNGDKSSNVLENLAWKLPIENSADKHRHGTTVRGERMHCAKLTEADVREMRRLKTAGGIRFQDLADRFGVSHRAAFAATTGITWKHVGE